MNIPPTTTFREYQLTEGVELDATEVSVLGALFPHMSVSRSLADPFLYDVRPESEVGVVRVGERTFTVEPKVPIHRLGFVLSYALDLVRWHKAVPYASAGTLADLVAALFAHALADALRRGLLQGYRAVEEAATTVRGRIRIDEQIRRRPGQLVPIEVGYDDFTEDIDANRVLRSALHRLSRLPLRHASIRRKLAILQGPFVDTVSLVDYRPNEIPDLSSSRLDAHYRPALELAKLILRSTTPETGIGAVDAAGFVVDMNQVFESFVRVALREELGLRTQAFPSGKGCPPSWLDRRHRVGLDPDLSWWEGGRCSFVGDAKYKQVNVAGIKHPDLYQLLAYVTAFELPGGLLVYASGGPEEVVHEVGRSGTRLEVATVDLDGEPAQILQSMSFIADRVRVLRSLAHGFVQSSVPVQLV
jgi:5-methylcytosine-specific restriction enzyme subunit McrC